MGRRDRGVQRRRHRAGPAGDRRRRPPRGRARLRRRRARLAAPPPRRRRAGRRRARLLGLQVVRPAHGDAVRAARRSWPSTSRTSSSPRRTSRRTAGSWARCRSSRWPACARRPSTCSSWTSRRCTRTSRRCSTPRSTASGAMDKRDRLRRRRRPRADADVQRRRPLVRRGGARRWPRRRSPCGTATTTPTSWSATSTSRRTAPCAPGFLHYNDAADAERLLAAVAAL